MIRRTALGALCLAVVATTGCTAAPASVAPTPGAPAVAEAPTAVTRQLAAPLPAAAPAKPWAPMDAGGLNPVLAERWAKAQAAGRAAGVTLTLTSGYRSAAEQQELFDEALAQYGSEAAARRWVLTPYESSHVRGMAIDVGPTINEMAWLEKHQEEFGLCRMYRNEEWHFEPRPDGLAKCPPMLPSANG